MSDLVKRLRAYAYVDCDEGAQGCIYWVAADHIEALEAQLAAADELAGRVGPLLKYKTSSDAYKAIHSSCAYWLEGWIEDGLQEVTEKEIREMMIVAQLMREIEGHTDVD